MKRRLLLPVLPVVLGACAGLLGIKPREVQHPFEHRKHSTQGVSCVTCHEGITRAGDLGPLHLPDAAKCVSCHASPHDKADCLGCHGTAHNRAEAALAREHLRFSHDKHLTPLGGQCVPCHAAAGKTDQTTLRPPMAQCFTCHTHKDQWQSRDCEACHVDLPRELAQPSSHVVHDGDFVREHGVRAASSRDLCASCHAESRCASCHGVTTAALPWKLSFDKPSLSGLHRAGFLQRHADESRANPGLCSSCHGDGTFCSSCHGKRRVGGEGPFKGPHPASWVTARGGDHGREARIDPGACAACHGGRGEALCVGCHRVGGPGRNPHGRGFSSTLDKMKDDPCRQCHAP